MASSRRSIYVQALLLIGLACLTSVSAAAQTEPWIGRWASPHCGPDTTAIVLSRSVLDLSTFEATCRVRSVRRRERSYRLDASCSGEGPNLRATFSVRVDGDTLVFTEQRGFAFDPKRFVRCSDVNERRDASSPNTPQTSSGGGASLPLKRGFYVASDTPCGQASNATLQLLRRKAMGAARTLCSFAKVEQIGSTRYRVTATCKDMTDHRDDGADTDIVTYDIPSETSFIARRANGADYSARFCEQKSLPQPWRSNDIRDLIR
jgi:hypothetical protein